MVMTATQAFRHLGILAAAALIVTAVGLKPVHAIETDSPAPPPDPLMQKNTDKKKVDTKHKKKHKNKKKSDAEFLREYRAARALMLEHKYRDGIAAMHAIGYDEHPDIANYIGYAYRRLGDFDDARIWYEKALAADPNHVRTWSYYGMLQVEEGNRLKALDDLQKVKLICGNTSCRAYVELKAVIDGKASY
jgi:tetratricopeptide (TPR) repeat protein